MIFLLKKACIISILILSLYGSYLIINLKLETMNAQQILEAKGIESNEAASIVYEELDMQVRELYNVDAHEIQLWEKYTIGDANETEVLKDAESNTTPIRKYDDIDELFDDMTNEIERLASIYE